MVQNSTGAYSHNSDLLPVHRRSSFWKGSVQDLLILIGQREILRVLVIRQLKQRYRYTLLGWGWASVRPLVLLAVYGLVAGVFLGMGDVIPQYAIYLYVGLITYSYFSSIVSGCIHAPILNAGLLKKAAFRSEHLLLAVVFISFIDLVIQGSMLLVAFVFLDAWPSFTSLFWVLAGVLVITTFALGVGFILAIANSHFRDVGHLSDLALQVMLWFLPIMYSFLLVRDALLNWSNVLYLYMANPVFAAISSLRYGLWAPATSAGGSIHLPNEQLTLLLIAVSGCIGFTIMWLGQRLFSRAAPRFAEIL